MVALTDALATHRLVDDQAEAVELANDLCLAALLGDGIYNMGELLSHAVLDSLRGTQQQWLVDLVAAFNAGDVKGFIAMKPVWSSQSGDLTNAEDALLEKVRLLSVMEQVFRRQSKDRAVPFSDLAAAANIAEDEVCARDALLLWVCCSLFTFFSTVT